MNQVGPPPQRPLPPEVAQPNHILHLILTLITFGVWALVWILVAADVNSGNKRRQREYREAQQLFEHRYAEWQYAYFTTYGQPPPPM